ncbi:semaphorin-4F [Gadus chalcogrammus]|uniref:semaphorin-4F n=1 Tax=Gadus chalcogrammus TaxID=1042646 RepID=UPI0024C4A76D|nr:semaphorin-4F [Gadus chalcogrammus]
MLGPDRFEGVANFSTFLLDNVSGMLFMGAKDAIVAVNTNDLSRAPTVIRWDVPEDRRKSCKAKGKTEVDCNNYIRLLEILDDDRIYVCGTYAFDPQCAFLGRTSLSLEREDQEVRMETGKGKCPFEPSQHYTAVMAGGILYTAATSNFLGTMFDISRATGPEQGRIRTERSINWLNDPEFVSASFIQQDPTSEPLGDDDKLYFFFTEVAKEYEMYTKVKVPRVARVCKSDVGGMKTLQRRWTTFLKAQLVCEDRPSGQRYNVLTDVFTLRRDPNDPATTQFYGLFTSQWEREELAAVCVFSLSDINKVMDGPFKELKKTCENWINPEPVPRPRPGQCLNSALRAEGFESSLKLPDKVLTFTRDHPLMENSVTAAPLLLRRGVTYTKLAVTLADGGAGALLHLGTDRGELHRVAVVGQNTTLLQEVPLFPADQPINNIVLHQGQALVGTPQSLARVAAQGCGLHPSCEVCARARGLGCTWTPPGHGGPHDGTCGPAPSGPGPGDMVEEALKKCNSREGRCTPAVRELRVSLGLQLLLPCVQVSPRPCSWTHPPQRHTRQHHSHLEVTVSEESLGTYVCTCQEAGPDRGEPTSCRRAAYDLVVAGPFAGGAVATAGNRHLLAIYILCFCLGLAMGTFLLYFLSRRHPLGLRLAKRSLSSDKGRDLLGSSATPQSPGSASLLSDAFTPSEKRNGTAMTSLHSTQGNGGPHGNHSYSSNLISNSSNASSNPGNGHGEPVYSNYERNASILPADRLDGRTGERGREGGEDVDEGLGEGLGDSMRGLEEEMAKFPLYKSPAPLARCEESSI